MTLEEAMKRIEELEAQKEFVKAAYNGLYGRNQALQYAYGKLCEKHERATARLAEINGW